MEEGQEAGVIVNQRSKPHTVHGVRYAEIWGKKSGEEHCPYKGRVSLRTIASVITEYVESMGRRIGS